jgi:sigma-B regulation protein RsbU (phosphoserine phosphatase)
LLAREGETGRMQTGPIILATSSAGADAVSRLHLSLSASWPGAVVPDITPARIDQVDLSAVAMQAISAIIVLLDESISPSLLATVLAGAEEANVAVVIMGRAAQGQHDVAEHAGVMLLAGNTPASTTAAILFGMLHRQGALDRIRNDLDVISKFQGGLRGEINKIHEELQLAALVQRQFLPHQLPKLHGIEFAVLWRPANYIAGDIYQIDRLDDDHVGVFLADAVGHGVPAALMTMAITQSLTMTTRSGRRPVHMQPSEVLMRINAEMIDRQDHNARFATGIYAIINCKKRVMTLAGAGHPPPILLHADGTSEELKTTGGLLGIFPDEEYDQIEFSFEMGDRILIYSDGFEQAFPGLPAPAGTSHERRLPNDRYLREFDELRTFDTPDQVVESMSMRLDAEMGSLHQVDDLTLICMLAGPAKHSHAEAPSVKLRV